MPIDLGKVNVHVVYYETPAQLFALLHDLEFRCDLDPEKANSAIVLAVPDKLRRLMDWKAKGTPRPEIHRDVLAFQRPR